VGIMNNKNILKKITQGVYVITTTNGGCIVDAVSQVGGGEYPLISVSINKNNYTNELVKTNKKFVLSIIPENNDGAIIKNFGYNSSRDINKFANGEFININGIMVPKNTIGYIECEVIDSVDTNTHDLFIAKVINGDIFTETEPMTYAYYQNHKDELIKVTTSNNKISYVCTICGYIYYGDHLPEDYKCPICGVGASLFKEITNE
jgi:flavin reductase (DIM6/NTAB) family NADH-FMN oxidoreductase RutF/rubredoxin